MVAEVACRIECHHLANDEPLPGRADCLAEVPGSKAPSALKLFISYSHQDEDIKNELLKHLSPLKRLNLISDWHDRKIEAGDKRLPQVSQVG